VHQIIVSVAVVVEDCWQALLMVIKEESIGCGPVEVLFKLVGLELDLGRRVSELKQGRVDEARRRVALELVLNNFDLVHRQR